MQLQHLTAEHAELIRSLRIRAAAECPSAFSASPEEEAALSAEQIAAQLTAGPPYNYTLGALSDRRLLGLVNLVRFQRSKVTHKAMLGGMYVLPEAQGQGIGHALLDYTLGFAKALAGVETLTLAVTVGNTVARALYQRAGFVSYGVEPRYIHVGDQYYDIEWMYCDLGSSTAASMQGA